MKKQKINTRRKRIIKDKMPNILMLCLAKDLRKLGLNLNTIYVTLKQHNKMNRRIKDRELKELVCSCEDISKE